MLNLLLYLRLQLFDRISSNVITTSRSPSGDAISRCRDAVDSIQSAASQKLSRDRSELVHLLGSPHIQVGTFLYLNGNNLKPSKKSKKIRMSFFQEAFIRCAEANENVSLIQVKCFVL